MTGKWVKIKDDNFWHFVEDFTFNELVESGESTFCQIKISSDDEHTKVSDVSTFVPMDGKYCPNCFHAFQGNEPYIKTKDPVISRLLSRFGKTNKSFKLAAENSLFDWELELQIFIDYRKRQWENK